MVVELFSRPSWPTECMPQSKYLYHYNILIDFAYWNLTLFLQTRNPNVPAISSKLIRPEVRNSLARQHNYWDMVMEIGGPIHCIYTDKELHPKDYDLDHFIPWSFVSHDLLWNLIPSDASINSSKSNNLPDLNVYLPKLAELQHHSLQLLIKNNKEPKVMEDFISLGYGFSIAAMGLALVVMYRAALAPHTLLLALLLVVIAVIFIFYKLPKIGDEGQKTKEKLIDFEVLNRSHLRWGVIAQLFYNGGQTAINSLFLVYCCSYAGLPEETATTYFGLYMLAFLLGRWIGTGLMERFRPQDMLLVYALVNVVLCGVIMSCGGLVGLYAMLGVSFFMSIMYPTQFSLALKDLGDQTKSGSAFLVMAIVGNACLPQLTAYLMHVNGQLYHVAYVVPMLCFLFCAYYGWRGYKVIEQ